MKTLLTIIIAFVALIAPALPERATASTNSQYYELRTYTTKSAEQQKRISDYWQHAAVPAYNRMGILNVGVFTEMEDSPTNNVYVLIAYHSMQEFALIPTQLQADTAYKTAAVEFLSALKTNAAYESFESTLLVAFDGMKQMFVAPADKKPNVFELRTYISPSEGKGLNKIQMFEAGEISTMKEVGLSPIFFARKVVGSQMPSLVYMTSGENLDEHKKHWEAFSASPTWKQLLADPQYKDNMKGMVRVMLKRTPASQL